MLNTFRKNSVNQQTATTPQVINAPDMNLQLESLNNRIDSIKEELLSSK